MDTSFGHDDRTAVTARYSQSVVPVNYNAPRSWGFLECLDSEEHKLVDSCERKKMAQYLRVAAICRLKLVTVVPFFRARSITK